MPERFLVSFYFYRKALVHYTILLGYMAYLCSVGMQKRDRSVPPSPIYKGGDPDGKIAQDSVRINVTATHLFLN